MTAVLVIVILIYAAYIISRIELRNLRVCRYSISSPKYHSDTPAKIIFMSDLHACSYGEGNSTMLDCIAREGPDIILLGGDMINRLKKEHAGEAAREDARVAELIGKLSETAPVYYAPGNHEKSISENDRERWEAFLKMPGTSKAQFLFDQSADTGNNVSVSGLDCELMYYQKLKTVLMSEDVIAAHLGKPDKNIYNILLAHSPDNFDACAAAGFDLILSGHLHGGVVGLPGGRGLISTSLRLFPKYAHGLFEKNGAAMIVTCGAGSHHVNIRLFNRPEITVISLSGAETEN